MRNLFHLRDTVAPTALALALVSQPAWAQDPVPNNSAALETAPEQDVGEAPAIIVTGTRIVRPELDVPNPIVSYSEEAIELSGQTNITQLLAQSPALFNSETNYDAAGSQARFGGSGVNLLDLRNLGPERTLVLVNGRRHVAGVAGEAAVDINTIPVGLIDRVDIVTGGVSSIYGADGVSGVVNFVLKRDFEGLEVTAQQGISEFKDAPNTFLSATVGTNFADDRGNITFSYEYRRDGRVAFADRPFGQPESERLVRNPDDFDSEGEDIPTVFDNIFLGNIRYQDSSPDGAVIVDPSFTPLFRGGGQPYDLGIALPESGGFVQGGSSTPIAAYQGDLQARNEINNLNLLASYEITPDVRFFFEGKYLHSNAFSVSQPSYDLGTFVRADNPYIPASIRAAIVPRAFDDPRTPEVDLPDGVLFSRDNFDLGTRNERISRDLYRGVVGFDGSIGENATFELSYVFGRNDYTFVSENYRLADRYFAALDAVQLPNGSVVCRVDVEGGTIDPFNYGREAQTFTPGANSGCAPLNIFGEGVASAAALGFINVDLTNEVQLTQHVVNGFVSGDFGALFELPGGPVGFAFGGEYRKEESRFDPDPISTQTVAGEPGTGLLADLALLGPERGSFDVVEGFAELNLPLLADLPFAERLDFGAAIRVSDYSTIGTTTSWSVNGTYAPIRDVTFRGSYSKAVRAPNVTELFSPTQGSFSFLSDPCSPVNINNGTEFREANCRALLTGLGVDFDQFDFDSSDEASTSLPGLSAGNQELTEEEARTWTAGVIVQPSFLRGFSVSFDWYDIRLEQAINSATLQQLSEFCVDAPTIDNVFCNNITRDQSTGYVTDYLLQPQNVAFFETAGADITASYTFSPGDLGRFAITGTVGYLDKLLFLPANGGIVDNDRGEAGAPKWVGTGDVTWQRGNLLLNYGVNFVGPQRRYEYDVTANDPDTVDPEYLYYDSVFTHDLRAEIQTDDEQAAFFVGVNNFTDERPARGSSNTPVGFLGRFYYVGVRTTLADLFD
jgi:outer membrane receptor protein involved in Fe transport